MSGSEERQSGAAGRLLLALSAGLFVTLVGGSFAFGFSLRMSATRKLFSALYAPGLRVAGHLHVPSFEGWFLLAGLVNWMLYAALAYVLIRIWSGRGK